MKRNLLTIVFVLLGTWLFAQQVVITGKVHDLSGEPLPGVNVVEKGTQKGTTTGTNGEYQIAVSKNTVLVFSYIGYVAREETVTQDQILDIQLKEEAYQLNDIVVTALGITQEKKTIGYSTQQVKTEELTRINSQNVGNLLTGQVAGLAVSTLQVCFRLPHFHSGVRHR
jgi:ferric enterobactin receptor